MEPIEQAGWKPPLWLGMEWQFTLLLGFLALVAVISKSLWFAIFALVVILLVYRAMVAINDREPRMTALFSSTQRYALGEYSRLADADAPRRTLPKANRL